LQVQLNNCNMGYRKINDNEYELDTPRILISKISADIDQLRAEKNLLVNPTNDELIEYGKTIHPFFRERERLDIEIEVLKALKAELQAL